MKSLPPILAAAALGIAAIPCVAGVGACSDANAGEDAAPDSAQAPASTEPAAHAAAHQHIAEAPVPSIDQEMLANWRILAEERVKGDADARYSTLTEADYRTVAAELGVEVAAIKAVVRIEAGAAHEGFWAPGVPVVNFDKSMYNKARPTSSARATGEAARVPAGIKSAYGRKEWGQLVAHRKINEERANMGTFWGMFQIGGFNYKKCGCRTVAEFVERMSFSEFEQLQLFANFITNTGMLVDLKNKDWRSFARKYNGASYAARGYHTRMASAYAQYKSQKN